MNTRRMLQSLVRGVALAGVMLTMVSPGVADETTGPVVLAVEEDWVLALGAPDVNTGSPQVATQMNPDASENSSYAIFCLNYQEIPRFVEGGIEIQLWYKEWVIDVDGNSGYKLALENETLSWTQVLKVESGQLSFTVKDGHSSTYGSFGDASFKVAHATLRTNLNAYDSQASVTNSGVSLGANRVKSLKLKTVRKYMSDGSVVTDNNIKVAYEETVATTTTP